MFKLIQKRNPDPKFEAIGFVWFTQLVHICLILAIIKKAFILSYWNFSETYFYNKLFLMPFAIIWLLLFYWYFKKHTAEIEKSFEGRNVLTFKNGVIVVSVLLIPLFIMIQLLKK